MSDTYNASHDDGQLCGGVRLFVYYGFVALAHLVGWGSVALLASRYPPLAGLGALAYGLGIRHAFDADHIVAIDNVTRTLIHSGKSSYGTGFFFSLGHSSVVFLVAALLGLTARRVVAGMQHDLAWLYRIGGFVGTGISGVCLLGVGLINCIILVDLYRRYRANGVGEKKLSDGPGGPPAGGLLIRLFGGFLHRITSAGQMYFVGFLFGLGFDTASEIALLAASAGASSNGTPFLAVMSLPTLFAAGMLLMDTSDAAFMTRAYRWASSWRRRRHAYNMTMTGISVATAIAIGSIELLRLAVKIFRVGGAAASLLDHVDSWFVGAACAALFAILWATISFARRRRLS